MNKQLTVFDVSNVQLSLSSMQNASQTFELYNNFGSRLLSNTYSKWFQEIGRSMVLQILIHLAKSKLNQVANNVKMGEHSFFSDTLKTLHEFQKKSLLCDVKLRCTGDTCIIPAHRAILATRSSFFKAMFTSDMKESKHEEAVLGDINTDSLQSIVWYCYTGDVNINPSNAEDLLASGHMLGLQFVQNQCFKFLQNNMDINNAHGIAYLADKYNCPETKRIAKDFIFKNFRYMTNSPSFTDLSFEDILQLASNDNLNVLNEAEVYEAIIKWVKSKPTEREKYLSRLLHHIRFPLIPRKFLIDNVTKEELIINDSDCREYLYKALDYHLVPERRTLCVEKHCTPRVNFASGIYVLGGENRTGVLDTVERFQLTDQCWYPCAQLNKGRKHPAVVLLNGAIYCIGGIDSNGHDLTCVEKYDPLLNTWSHASSMASCRGIISATVLDGWIYACGGTSGSSSLKSVERYDTIINKWLPVQPMKFARSCFGTGNLNGALYAVGGRSNKAIIEYCEEYDPLTNKWKELATLNKSRMDHGVTSFNSKLFAIGGINNRGILDCIEKYNQGLNMWLIIKHTLDPRTGASILLVNNDVDEHWLYIIGGIDESHCCHSSVKKVNLKSVDYTVGLGKCLHEPRAYSGAVAL